MSDLKELEQKVEEMQAEMQAEIERLECAWKVPEIPVGTLCWFWDNDDEKRNLGVFSKRLTDGLGPYVFRTVNAGWKNARIASDIPGVMVWKKHGGGPCPVDGDIGVAVKCVSGDYNALRAGRISWGAITAYAIINKAEWME